MADSDLAGSEVSSYEALAQTLSLGYISVNARKAVGSYAHMLICLEVSQQYNPYNPFMCLFPKSFKGTQHPPQLATFDGWLLPGARNHPKRAFPTNDQLDCKIADWEQPTSKCLFWGLLGAMLPVI